RGATRKMLAAPQCFVDHHGPTGSLSERYCRDAPVLLLTFPKAKRQEPKSHENENPSLVEQRQRQRLEPPCPAPEKSIRVCRAGAPHQLSFRSRGHAQLSPRLSGNAGSRRWSAADRRAAALAVLQFRLRMRHEDCVRPRRC